MRRALLFLAFVGLGVGAFLLLQPEPTAPAATSGHTGAYHALQWFAHQRAYPQPVMPREGYAEAFVEAQSLAKSQQDDGTRWQSLGPHNISGRILAVAVDPSNPDILWAGSASGGVWRSTTGGEGTSAWERLTTGFPVLGVSAIAIDPTNPDVVYIGTGEVYNRPDTQGGLAIRETRGSYGIGILKTTDGGQTWTHSLDWSRQQQRGVQMLRLDPSNPNTLWAATTEGVYVSHDAGATWSVSLDVVMATDIQVFPDDPNLLLAACGNLGSARQGLYRSINGGATWTEISFGLPDGVVFGKKLLDIAPSNPNIVYMSVGRGSSDNIGPGAVGGRGNWLYRSANRGVTWQLVSTEDYANLQGWYAHFVTVHPTFPDSLVAAGIWMVTSRNGGVTMHDGPPFSSRDVESPIGGPEGPPDYIHVDMHGFARHPTEAGTVFIATDGGVFRSRDFARTFEALNGGLQTAQFYPGTSHSAFDSLITLGGLQDNGVILYRGDKRWRLVLGGDGNYTAIDPRDNGLTYSTAQFINLFRSSDDGFSFNDFIGPPVRTQNATFETAFIAPFALAPSAPDVIYAARDVVYRSPNRGVDWIATNQGFPLDGNFIISMAVAPSDENIVYVGTSPFTARAGLFRTLDGGQSWINVTRNLPDRVPTDIAVDPRDEATAYVVFSGFGTSHVFKTTDFGDTWQDISAGLPDVPTSAVAIDAVYTGNVFVGTDLGVFFSRDEGATWEAFNEGLPEAVLVMDLGISEANGHLRVATHGNGMYERTLLEGRVTATETDLPHPELTLHAPYPHPFTDRTTLTFAQPATAPVTLVVYDIQGREVMRLLDETLPMGTHTVNIDAADLPAGTYIARLQAGGHSAARVLTHIR